MPTGDRTGPMGQGSRTGKALGFCSGYDTPGNAKGFGGGIGRGFVSGRGMGCGMGRGMRRGKGRVAMLRTKAETLKQSLQEIEVRLNDLEKGKD
jgi:hypothetical protein